MSVCSGLRFGVGLEEGGNLVKFGELGFERGDLGVLEAERCESILGVLKLSFEGNLLVFIARSVESFVSREECQRTFSSDPGLGVLVAAIE